MSSASRTVRNGNPKAFEKVLSSFMPSSPNEPFTDEQRALFELCAARLDSGLNTFAERSWHWLVSEFMIRPLLMPAITPLLLESTLEKLLDSDFPAHDYTPVLAEHRSHKRVPHWGDEPARFRIAAIGDTIETVADARKRLQLEMAYFSGIQKLPDVFRSKLFYVAKVRNWKQPFDILHRMTPIFPEEFMPQKKPPTLRQ